MKRSEEKKVNLFLFSFVFLLFFTILIFISLVSSATVGEDNIVGVVVSTKPSTTTVSGGGSGTFDQSLNTTDNVTFWNLSLDNNFYVGGTSYFFDTAIFHQDTSVEANFQVEGADMIVDNNVTVGDHLRVDGTAEFNDNVEMSDNLTVAGNISASYYEGDGSLLTGISAGDSFGDVFINSSTDDSFSGDLTSNGGDILMQNNNIINATFQTNSAGRKAFFTEYLLTFVNVPTLQFFNGFNAVGGIETGLYILQQTSANAQLTFPARSSGTKWFAFYYDDSTNYLELKSASQTNPSFYVNGLQLNMTKNMTRQSPNGSIFECGLNNYGVEICTGY